MTEGYNPETKRIDVSDCKNMTAKRNKIRKITTEMLMDFCREKFGFNDDDVLQIGTNEIAVVVSDTTEDGFPYDICVVGKFELKPWTDSRGARRQTPAFDRFNAAQEYQDELKAKAAKKKS